MHKVYFINFNDYIGSKNIMNIQESIQEQSQHEIAKKWLNENGKFEVFPFKGESNFKIVFKNNETKTELIGEDVVRLTLQLYNEVRD